MTTQREACRVLNSEGRRLSSRTAQNFQNKTLAKPLSSVLSPQSSEFCPQSSVLCPQSSESGFSLVEMMISITIGLMIIVALLGVLTSNARNSKSNDRTAELQINGRYALDQLKRELRHAGYRGYTNVTQDPQTATLSVTTPTGSVVECGGARFVQNLDQGIWGANDSNPFDGDCLKNGYLQGDVLVIRRLASAPAATVFPVPASAPVALTSNTFYQYSNYDTGQVFQGPAQPSFLTAADAPVAIFPIQVYVYYIGLDDNDENSPALRRIALQADGSLADEMVVSGIEQLQVQYGTGTQYLNSVDSASALEKTSAWNVVNSVRVWMLARSKKIEAGYSNTNAYAMGDIVYGPMNDGFRRQVFTSVVQLRK